MNYKKIFIPLLLFSLLIPITQTIAFTHIDNLKNGNYVFFLTELNVNQSLELTLNHEGSGNFTLFLFNRRPVDSKVNDDNTLKPDIFYNPPTVAYSLEEIPYIYYTASEEKIYYIEIILISGGPDTFTLTVNEDLTRYYLPLIPGFQSELVLLSLTFAIGLIIFLFKKKMKK
jgi:hypothetical protein